MGLIMYRFRKVLLERLKVVFEDLRTKYHRVEETRHDPVQFVHLFSVPSDREIVGLLASSLAFGSVKQIIRATNDVLVRMDGSPTSFCSQDFRTIDRCLKGFSYRFVCSRELAELLYAAGRIQGLYGSLRSCFCTYLRENDENTENALRQFVLVLRKLSKMSDNFLVPTPFSKSPYKRMNLFLRWMVRKDEIDPGGWEGIPRWKLIVPLDTHIYRMGIACGMTKRRVPDGKTALEITSFLRAISPDDPLRYDFALVRFGVTGGNWRDILR